MRRTIMPVGLAAAVVSFGLGSALAKTPDYTCNKAISPKGKALVGERGEYEVKQGLVTKKTMGFLKRKNVAPARGCFVPMSSSQCVVLQYKKADYKKAKFAGQCVLVASGKAMPRSFRPKERPGGPIRGEHILTKCPNKTGYACDAGHNSDRGNKHEKALKAKGLLSWSFCARGANNNLDKRIGKKVFCQLYDKTSGQVAFATEYTFKYK